MWPHHYYYTAVYDVAGAELYLCELMEELWRGDTWLVSPPAIEQLVTLQPAVAAGGMQLP